MIDLREAIATLNSGNWVSVAYVNFDKKRQKFGEIVRIPKCRVANSVAAQPSTGNTTTSTTRKQNPNHSEHFTKNVTLPNGQIRKLHLRLLFSINNERVL